MSAKFLKSWMSELNSLDLTKNLETTVQSFLEQLKQEINLTSEEKEKIIEKLEPMLSSSRNGKAEHIKELPITIDTDYPLYNFEEFQISDKSWQDINPDNYNYPTWLLKVGLPEFWIQPSPELQHPLLVASAFINSYAVPSWSSKARKEAQLPLIVFSGESRSGKTEGCKFILQNYASKRTAFIKADSTGVCLREAIHEACYDEARNRLLPSCVLIDNFEHGFLEKWGSFKMVLLSVLRSQATCGIGSKEGRKTFHLHCLKLFTTVEGIKAFNGKQSEFYNRQVFFFTERQENVKSLGNYNFSDVVDIYKDIWSSQNTKQSWFPILASLLKLDDNATACPPYRWSQSLLLMATGIYIGIWNSITEASDFMATYWAWVDQRENQYKVELELLVKSFLNEYYQQLNISHWYRLCTASKNKEKDIDEIYQQLRLRETTYFRKDAIISYVMSRSSSNRRDIVSFISDYLELKKYVLELGEDSHPIYRLPDTINNTYLTKEFD